LDWSHREARARRAEAEASRAYHDALARWAPNAQRLRELIDTAQTLGTADAAPMPGCPIALKYGEAPFFWLPNVSLVETDLDRDRCNDGYSGCSLHVLRNVEWRARGTRDSTVPVAETPPVVDVGTVTITNHRVVFQGEKHARVWSFSKLLGIHDDATTPWTAIAVSNHQKVFGLLYTEDDAEEFRFRLHLAVAEQQGNRAAVIASLEQERTEHDAVRPEAPVPGSVPPPMGSPVRGFAAWPRWARVTIPIVVVAVLGVMMGAVTGGQASTTFEAQSPLGAFIPKDPPGAPIATVPPRTTKRISPTGRSSTPRRVTLRATPGTTETRLLPPGSVAARVLPPARHRAPSPSRPPTTSPPPTTEPPTTSPPTTEPPSTSPPTTSPPTTSPPTTEPPTTSPPTTEPPTTSPPTTEPPEGGDVPGAPCSPVGAVGQTSDGAPMLCVVDILGGGSYWLLI